MAKMRIAPEILAEFVFGYAAHPVTITGVSVDHERGEIIFDISGHDVPDEPEVRATINVQENRARQRLLTMTFEAVK